MYFMEPGKIKKLDECVVNRIAAGEVIQRPANAIKEMLENSLDAKSTFIQVTVKSGGLLLLQIQDNGTGIRKEDLEIVCERFTTSKLEKFDDLTSISTYGFRGEALSSISHVAHLTIQTKTAQEMCAFKACYEDGKLKDPIKPCAGNQGTIITVEDLFYNVPQRKQILKSPNEEFQRISDVISKYAVHNSHVSFMLRKQGENVSIRTLPNSTQIDNIRSIFGTAIAKELMEIEIKDSVHQFNMKGYITNVNYFARKGIFLLFINHRLVNSNYLKSAIDSVYSLYLPKANSPFIYISIELDPTNVDVNVHPTKHEVHFLHEDDIIEKIKSYIEAKLVGSNDARTFYKQMRLPGSSEETEKPIKADILSESQRVYDKDLIRTDSKEQKLEKFLISSCSSKMNVEIDDDSREDITFTIKTQCIPVGERKETKLTSILSMRKNVENCCSSTLRRIVKEMHFVGVVNRTFALVQFETKLYMCNTLKLSVDLFYQLLIYNFENFKIISFENPLSVRDLARIALDTEESGWTEDDGPKDELADRIVKILKDRSIIMKEYFGLVISDGQLESLPALLDNHKPPMSRLPMYILRLATEVEWRTEDACFETFCQETATFYASVAVIEEGSEKHKWIVEHVIYPSFKQYLIPNKKLKPNFFELANLPNLYKVFERC